MDRRFPVACCKFCIRTHTDIDILAYFSGSKSCTTANIRSIFRTMSHGIARFRQSGCTGLPSLIGSLP